MRESDRKKNIIFSISVIVIVKDIVDGDNCEKTTFNLNFAHLKRYSALLKLHHAAVLVLQTNRRLN
jgi:hypothetical protein